MPRTLALASPLAALVLHGCGRPVFACGDPSECPGGTCEPSGYCSFPDDACPSGQRYGDYAPAALADVCVEPIDATTSGTGGTSSSAATTLEGSVGELASSTAGEVSTLVTTSEPTTTSTGEAMETSEGVPLPDVPEDRVCIVETFDDGSIDVFLEWNAGLPVDMSDGTLHVTLLEEQVYFGIDSPTLGFVDRSLEVTVLAVPNQGTSTQVTLGVSSEPASLRLLHEYGVLAVRYDDGMQWENYVEVVPYAQSQWRAWTQGDIIGFDRRALGETEWETLWSEVTPFDLADASAFMAIGTWTMAEMEPGEAQLDDLSECPYP